MVNDNFVGLAVGVNWEMGISINDEVEESGDNLQVGKSCEFNLHYLIDLKNVGNFMFILSTLLDSDPNVTVTVYSVLTLILGLYST